MFLNIELKNNVKVETHGRENYFLRHCHIILDKKNIFKNIFQCYELILYYKKSKGVIF